MKKLIFLAISCLVALSGMAQAKVYSFSLDNNKHLKASMAKAKPAQRHAKAMTAEKPEGAVIWEDFSKFTAGSEDAPDATDVNDPSTGAIPDDMTLTPGWEGMGIKQAGGIAYVGTYDEYGWDETGYLKTSPADLSANGGTCTVRFRAKSASTEGDQVAIRLANPTNTYIGEQRVELTAEWQDYEVKLNNGTADAFIHFYSVWHEWYIDDIAVLTEGIPSPVNLHVTSYKGYESTFAWDAVDGAEKYKVLVYYWDDTQKEYVYIVDGEETTETSYRVTDLDPAITYFFKVAAVQGTNVSAYSDSWTIMPVLAAPKPITPTDYDGNSFTAAWEPYEDAAYYVLNVFCYIDETPDSFIENQRVDGTSYFVEDLPASYIFYFTVYVVRNDGEISMESEETPALPIIETPVAGAATEVTSNSFVANWTPVTYANTYQVNVYREHTATADEVYELANTDCGVVPSDATLDNPDILSGSFIFGSKSGAFDWYISMAAAIDGGIGLDNTYAMLLGIGHMYSPLYDLTPFGGKADFEITMGSADATKAIVALAVQGEDGYLDELESDTVDVTSTMTSHTFHFTKGNESCCVLVYALDGVTLMFDNFRLTVNMPKGSKIEQMIDMALVQDATANSVRFDDIEFGNDRISYDVLAARIDDSLDDPIVSGYSNRVYVDAVDAVESVEGAGARAYVEGAALCVENPSGAAVEVYNMAGVNVFSDHSGETFVQAQLDVPGVYMVKVGGTVIKVIR